MELWTPPHDAPHLLEWWRPLMLVSRRARLDRFPWPVHLDEFRLTGRVVRAGRPDIWIYEHHENGGSLCVDATGETYAFTATPRAAGPGRFTRCELRRALWRAGLPDVVEPVRARGGDDGQGSEVPIDAIGGEMPAAVGDGVPATDRTASGSEEAGAGGEHRVIRRGHLTLVAG